MLNLVNNIFEKVQFCFKKWHIACYVNIEIGENTDNLYETVERGQGQEIRTQRLESQRQNPEVEPTVSQ